MTLRQDFDRPGGSDPEMRRNTGTERDKWLGNMTSHSRFYTHNIVQTTNCNTHQTPKKPGTNQLPSIAHCLTSTRHSDSKAGNAPRKRATRTTPSGVASWRINNRVNLTAVLPLVSLSSLRPAVPVTIVVTFVAGLESAIKAVNPSPKTTACGKLIIPTAVTTAPPSI